MRVWKPILGAVLVTAAAAAVVSQNGVGPGEGVAHAATPPAMPPMPVPVVQVVKRTIPIFLDYSARTESISNVALQAKVSGYIDAQPAADGADVHEGDLLYRIDPRDLQAALDQATAQAQRDVASLDYARANASRGDALAKGGWLAKDTQEQRNSALRQGQAALAMDNAAIQTARLNLSYTEIRAPFAGRLGRNQAPVGTLVSAGGAALNNLVQLDPIYVTFNPSETDLAEIQKARAQGKVGVDILLPGESQASHHGALTFIDNAVDRATGTITARATIGNADFVLLPGQYVRVRVHVRDEPDALLVPQAALGSNQLGNYVYVVGPDSRVDLRPVALGPAEGTLIAVRQGLKGDEQVINGNLQKIGPGAPVQIVGKPPAAS